MPRFIVTTGRVARQESGGLRIYRRGETIELPIVYARGLGDQIEPADRDAAQALLDAIMPQEAPSAKRRR